MIEKIYFENYETYVLKGEKIGRRVMGMSYDVKVPHIAYNVKPGWVKNRTFHKSYRVDWTAPGLFFFYFVTELGSFFFFFTL
ncbi:hypothetical protein Hdeb2414_s0001g00033831 [Helianthus debilis subsp. tardiflorus]